MGEINALITILVSPHPASTSTSTGQTSIPFTAAEQTLANIAKRNEGAGGGAQFVFLNGAGLWLRAWMRLPRVLYCRPALPNPDRPTRTGFECT
jgi:hypothetical protein